MPLLSKLKSFGRTLGRGAQLDGELDAELRSYVDELVARSVARGVEPDEARRAVLREVGGVEQVKERVREARVGAAVETTLRDLRYGARALGRSPGFALVVIATLALGIGANVTMFSVMRAVVWQRLPYPAPDRLVAIQAHMNGVTDTGASQGELQDLRRDSRTLEQLASVDGVAAYLDVDGELERVSSIMANDDLVHLLGAAPLALGRPLRAAEDYVSRAARSVIISDALWRRRFGADPGVVGRRMMVNNLDMEVVGVLRADFRAILPGTSAAAEEIDVWLPLPYGSVRAYRHSTTLARLAPGVGIEQARAELDRLAAGLVAAHPDIYPEGRLQLSVQPLDDVVTRPVRPALLALMGAVGFVLLIGCVNVANLVFARAGARQRELAVRHALGAGRGRIVRQLFAEHAVLAGAGGAAGLLMAIAGVSLVEWLRPMHLPRQSHIAVDGAAAVFAIALSMAVCLLVGLLPVLRISRTQGHDALRAGRADIASPSTRRLQRGLVVAEVALSIVPLVAGGLMLRTFWNLTQAPIGFDPDGLITANLSISFDQFPDAESRWLVQRDALERVRQIPGVEAASAASPLPFARVQYSRRVGRADDEAAGFVLANQQTIVPGYLQLAGTRLREGRDLTDDDTRLSRMAAIIDDRLARQLWPEGALGKRLAMRQGERTSVFEIVGVTDTVRTTSVGDTEVATVMVPYTYARNWLSLVIRTSRAPADIAPEIRRAVEPGTRRPVSDIRPMRDLVTTSIAPARFTMLILSGFALMSLLLTAIGLYGTLAYLTAQRRKEFGVRMALGASSRNVLHVVVREGLALTTIGAALGLAGASAVTGVLSGLLYDVTPLDPLTLLSVVAVTALVALAASGHPAWRAARAEPVEALRTD